MNNIENNQATISGEIAGAFVFSHEVYGEKFYLVDVLVRRMSGVCDTIPVVVSERLIDVTQNYEGRYISVSGQFRSYNKRDGKKNRLILSVFAQEISFAEKLMDDVNQVFLDGYICKEPIYRKTPLGREIADILLAVNRSYGKADYIPCVAWGRNARYAGNLDVGYRLGISGRIQSRKYTKRLDDGTEEERIAYEISVSKIELVGEE